MPSDRESISETPLRSVIRSLGVDEGGTEGSQICLIEIDGQARHYLVKRFTAKGRRRMQVLREIRQCRRLRHPAVAPLVDHFEQAGTLVVVFEHADGVRLDEIMGYLAQEGECLADSATWHLARQLFDALAVAHDLTGEDGRALHLVHGNLGPDRIYVTWDAKLWLYGAGLPSLFDDQGREPAMLAYHAPERRDGTRPVARADVYSAALVAWALLTGRQPEVGVSPENIARFCAELPTELARGLDNALQKSPLRRTLSCRALEHLVVTHAGAEDECPELQWNMDLFRGIVDGQVESERPTGFTAPPRLISVTPSDEEDTGRAPLMPGPGKVAGQTEDSTVQRLSDLFEALPKGADSVPAPDGDEDEGWLLEVVRKSTAGQEPKRVSEEGEGTTSDGRPAPTPGQPDEVPDGDAGVGAPNGDIEPAPDEPADTQPTKPAPAKPVVPESVSAAETVPAAASSPPPPESSPPPAGPSGSTPPPSPPPARRTKSTPPPLPSSSPPPSSKPSPRPAPPVADESPAAPAAQPSDLAGGLFAGPPEPAAPKPLPAFGDPVECPPWLIPVIGVAVAAGVVVALIALKPELLGLSGETAGDPTAVATGSRSRGPATPAPTASGSSAPPPTTGSGVAPPGASASAGPSSSASAGPDAPPAGSGAGEGDLPPVVDELGGDGSKLLSFEGYLIVRSPVQAEVVVQGRGRGPTNQKLKTHCRQKNVRLRDSASGAWLTAGEPVRIKCMGTTTVVIKP